MLGLRDQMMSADIGVQRAQTVRQSSTALLTIDSADRFTDQINRRLIQGYSPRSGLPLPLNYSAYNFTISKNESIMNGFFTRLAVTEVVFPWSIPNINIQTNTMFVDVEDACGNITTESLVLEDGFYTPAQLAAAIQLFVRTLPGLDDFTMLYSNRPFTNCFSYETGDVTIKIAFRPVPYNSPIYNNNSQILQLFDLLGFAEDRNTEPQQFQIGNPTLCQFTRYIDIVCPQLTYNQSLKDTSSQRTVRDALCRVYLGDGDDTNTLKPDDPNYSPPGCSPTVIYRNFSTPKQIQWSPNQPVPGFLQFQVFDDNGVLLSESGANVVGPDDAGVDETFTGIDWSMTMLVTEN